ncbi:MAG: hypothetical protein WCP29_16060 [Acidobacteriota bacterium]
MADPDALPESVSQLLHELGAIFGARLQSVSIYGANGEAEALTGGGAGEAHDHIHTLAVAASIGADDLRACARLSASWNRKRLAVPLLLTTAELSRSLDAFPLELGEILAHHRVVFGADVLAGLSVAPADARRACETQVRSHLLHLREGYIQAGAQPRALASIIQASARPFRLLLASVARLEGADMKDAAALARHLEQRVGVAPGVAQQVLAAERSKSFGATEAQDVYPAYVRAVEQLAQYIDAWQA